MLDRLQQRLSSIYGVDSRHDIRDFLITDRAVARALGRDQLIPNTDESVLLAEDEDGIALSVFLDRDMLERLDSADPLTRLEAGQLDDLWKVVEGVSHFNYLVWCAAQDRSVTLLELEMQAEVDKFVSTFLLLLEQGDVAMTEKLHGWLFEACHLSDELDERQRERYAAASDYASRFCHRLRERLAGRDRSVWPELRYFYRLTQNDKISHIRSRALTTA